MINTSRFVRKRESVTATLICCTASLAQLGCAAPAMREVCERVQPRLDAFCAQVGAPGATVGFVLPDGRSGAVATGISNKTTQQPMKPTDRMLMGSIGKTYVAAVLLQLLEEGRVELDTKIAHWFADDEWFARLPNAQDVTLQMLLNHTSGIPEHVWFAEFLAAVQAEPQKVWKPDELVAYVLDRDPLFSAGEGWSYADTNYILVGMIIERATGRTFYEELTRRVLKPRRLRDTIPSDRQELPGLISGYTSPQNPFGTPEEVATDGRYIAFNPQMEWTGGGLLTTTRDLARWARLLYAGDVLENETRTLMLTGIEAGPRLGAGRRYGLGVIIRDGDNGPVWGHSGFFPGYLSMMAYYPDLDVAVAIQFNTDQGLTSAAMEEFLDDTAAQLTREPAIVIGE